MKIGILGGTFDPVHNGHLKIAEYAVKKRGLSKIIFVPALSQPLKKRIDIVAPHHRMAMIKLATAGIKHYEVSDVEFQRQEASYTLKTIEDFYKKYPYNKFYFITGADCVEQFGDWYEFKKLCEICNFIIFSRKGFDPKNLDYLEQIIGKDLVAMLYEGVTEIDPVEISSTIVRDMLNTDKNVKDLIPIEVLSYIKKNKLYVK